MTLRLITDAAAGALAPPGPLPADLDDAAFRELFDHAGALLAILDAEGRFVAVGAGCMRVLGHGPELLVGRSLFDFVQEPDSPGKARGGRAVRGDRAAKAKKDPFIVLLARHQHADGSWRWLEWTGSAHGERWYAAARDVTERIRLEDRVGRDPLTQLPNREVFTDELTAALARRKADRARSVLESGSGLAVLFIDIDGLKQINDRLGHDAGDRLIAQIGERLRAAVRGGDVVARLGGDEFGVLVGSVDDGREAVSVAKRILAALEAPLELGNGPVAVSASIGVTTGDGRTCTAMELVGEADLAMYRAKADGRKRFIVFDSQMRAEMQLRLDVERDLHQALARDELVLHYQPIVALNRRRMIGAEALLRWKHPTRGLLLPGDFLPLAEQNGLIVPLGRWVLKTATRQAAAWSRLDSPDIGLSVNLSPRQLADPELVACVRAALKASRLAPERLCVEVGEAAVLADTETAAARLGQLRELGVRVAFDDFGAGEASLRALLAVPIDAIKLDRRLVAEFGDGSQPASRTIVDATVVAARALGIPVTACGVEHDSQLEPLAAAGCHSAQGNGVAPPANAAVSLS